MIADILYGKNYDMRFLYASGSRFPLSDMEEIVKEEHGYDGWQHFSVDHTVTFWKKNTPERNIS